MQPIKRRRLLALTSIAGAGVAWAIAGSSHAPNTAAPRRSGYPFTLGVASGDPAPHGVVLWTRLAPDPLAEDGRGGMPPYTMPVRWEVATDERFRHTVARGRTRATPELGHSVHVEVDGLRPDREYFYRFRVGGEVGGEVSPAGRTRTAPRHRDHPRDLSFAFASCQSYPAGFYTPYRHLANEDLDFVVHLGDYIYEDSAQGEIGRGHLPDRKILSLADYRVRYGQYKSDPDLQAAHAAFPWIVTLDDHEVENNFAADISQGDEDPAEFRLRMAAAFQAYYEHLPLRRSALPQGPQIQLFRRLRFGRLAELHVLDTRQYRDDQVCGDQSTEPCLEWFDPDRTMLGGEQERWLLDGLSSAPATWNVIAQQSLMARGDLDPEEDNWNGYPPARQRLLAGIHQRCVDNAVVISGDAHCSVVADLKLDFDDLDSPTVATEFLGTSISSLSDGADIDQRGQEWLAAHPHIRFYNQRRGYVRCRLGRDEWHSDYRVVPYVTRPGAPVETLASFVVEHGRPGAQVDAGTVRRP